MAAVKGKKGSRRNILLLQEPQAGARPPSALCSAWSSGFVGGLSGWVGSFNGPAPLQRQEHDSNIIPATFFFYVCARAASYCLNFNVHLTRAEEHKENAAYMPKSSSHIFL